MSGEMSRREQIKANQETVVRIWNEVLPEANAVVEEFGSNKYLMGSYTAEDGSHAPEIRLYQDGLNPDQFTLRVNLGNVKAAEELAVKLREKGLNILQVR